jgi:hypothetical protein
LRESLYLFRKMFFPSSCNWYGVTVAIALVKLLQLVESAGSMHLLFCYNAPR